MHHFPHIFFKFGVIPPDYTADGATCSSTHNHHGLWLCSRYWTRRCYRTLIGVIQYLYPFYDNYTKWQHIPQCLAPLKSKALMCRRWWPPICSLMFLSWKVETYPPADWIFKQSAWTVTDYQTDAERKMRLETGADGALRWRQTSKDCTSASHRPRIFMGRRRATTTAWRIRRREKTTTRDKETAGRRPTRSTPSCGASEHGRSYGTDW